MMILPKKISKKRISYLCDKKYFNANKTLTNASLYIIMHICCIIIHNEKTTPRCVFQSENGGTEEEMKAQSNAKFSCAIVGARGYAGLEAAKLLLRHPNAELKACFATSDFELSNFLMTVSSRQVACLPDSELMNNLADYIFLATPAEASLEMAPRLLAAGKTVIDLSGAFRLKQNDYKKWYGFEHTAQPELKLAQYGLSPWAEPNQKQMLIANPGCFATAVILALIPLLKENVISKDGLVIDAKSGATGAGKKAAENLLFTEVDGECLPYRVGRHQHYPEIVEAVEKFSGVQIDAHFTTSLLPVRRGIIAGVYARLQPNQTLETVQAAFEKAYAGYELLMHAPMSVNSGLVSLKKVVGTAKTHISYTTQGDKLYVFSSLDNLMKGAASQAVENFNNLSGLPVHTGLAQLEALI